MPATHSPTPAEPVLAGNWDVRLSYVRGEASHALFLEQSGRGVSGHHRGDLLSSDCRGYFDGKRLRLWSSHQIEGTAIGYAFDGEFDGKAIRGTVDLGEYGKAKFVAERHTGRG